MRYVPYSLLLVAPVKTNNLRCLASSGKGAQNPDCPINLEDVHRQFPNAILKLFLSLEKLKKFQAV